MGVDRRTEEEVGEVGAQLAAAGVSLSLGGYPDLGAFDTLILSPGVDPSQEGIALARAKGVSILPELELGAREVRGRLVCITGTKGKSTTTMSLHAMLRESGFDARAVGNIGEPITAHVDGSDENTIFVTEASSFQLETTKEFRPDCAVFLNLFPDHLDRHPSFHAYSEAKARIFTNQTARDTAVVNAEDKAVLSLCERTRARVIRFSSAASNGISLPDGLARFENGNAVFPDASATVLFEAPDVQIPGAAVRTNLLAAATTARHLGASTSAIRKAVRAFQGVPHTFEKLGEIGGVAFFNDSKATTLESVQVALRSFETPVIAIMGGRLKAGSFRTLREAVEGRVHSLYAIGETRRLILEALGDVCPVHMADNLEDAVRRAHAEANPGDTVLLSPGCSSFDMFRDYAERGDVFRQVFLSLSLKGAA